PKEAPLWFPAGWLPSVRVPLFPLHTVLFPETTLPLHVFEPRYREMIGRCLEHDESFGIALILDGDEVGGHAIPRRIGTEASIIACQRHAHGEYDIVAEGLRRIPPRGCAERLNSSWRSTGSERRREPRDSRALKYPPDDGCGLASATDGRTTTPPSVVPRAPMGDLRVCAHGLASPSLRTVLGH